MNGRSAPEFLRQQQPDNQGDTRVPGGNVGDYITLGNSSLGARGSEVG
jgi:hypothetical protein